MKDTILHLPAAIRMNMNICPNLLKPDTEMFCFIQAKPPPQTDIVRTAYSIAEPHPHFLRHFLR